VRTLHPTLALFPLRRLLATLVSAALDGAAEQTGLASEQVATLQSLEADQEAVARQDVAAKEITPTRSMPALPSMANPQPENPK